MTALIFKIIEWLFLMTEKDNRVKFLIKSIRTSKRIQEYLK